MSANFFCIALEVGKFVEKVKSTEISFFSKCIGSNKTYNGVL